MSARDEFVKAALGKDGENLLRYMKLDKESMGNIEKSEEKYKDVPELSICQDNNYDAVKVTKAMVEATKRLRNETGMI